MKPLKLTMTAFGPYKNTEVIDFEQLGDHRLFAISGKTGAGKTTIFDAICYALYGSASGEDRQDTAILRSGFADDDVYTAVELKFEMRGRIYQVLRQPGHIKEKNKSVTGKKIELAEIKEGILDYSIVEKQQTNEVDRKLQEIIGLTKDQFSQIVMLPQGEFRKLLTSDSTNKEVILRKIFKTDRFGDMTKKLDAKRKEAEKNLELAKQMKEHLFGQIAGALPPRESLLFDYIATNTDNIHQLKTALEEEQFFYAENSVVEQKRYDEAYAQHQKEQEHYSMAKALNEQFNEQEKRELRLQALENERSLYEAKEQEIKLAEQADRLLLFEQQCTDLRADQDRKEIAYQQAFEKQKTTAVEFDMAQKVFVQEEAKEQERQQAVEQEYQLQALLPIFETYESNRKQLHALEQEVITAQQAVTDNQAMLVKEQAAYQQFTQKITEFESQLQPYESYLEQLPKLREQVALLTQAEKYEKSIESSSHEVKMADHHYQNTKQTFFELEQKWIANQASILAAKLVEGEPCPVCGSTDHQVTHFEKQDVIDKDQLERMRALVQAEERNYFEKEAALKSVKQLYQETDEQLATLNLSVADQQNLKQTLQHVEQQIVILKVVNEQLAEARSKQKNLSSVLEKLQGGQLQLERHLSECTMALTKQQTIVAEQQKQIPENLQSLQALMRAIEEASKHKTALQTAWQVSQQNLQKTKEAASNATTAVELAKKAFEEVQATLNIKREQFAEKMKEVGFDGYQVYHAAKRNAAEIDALRKACNDYALGVHTLKVQIEEGSKQLQGKQKQDLVVLEDKLRTLRTTYEEAYNLLQRTKGYVKACEDFTVKIEEAADKIQALEKEAGRVKELHALLNGQNAKKVSFERYIQINYLDKITAAANLRLHHLSNGQFRLQRSDRLEKHAKQSGLGLDVYDAYTDQLRDVKTLSGGEKFNASLSLALGMADVIQSYQGNIRIETMFIDEGFGSLDEEALNKAIDTLIDLQDSGRMIGVISHVADLKAAMPAVLHVEKTLNGYSKTRFEIK